MIHNESEISFITSDNPVVYFDPSCVGSERVALSNTTASGLFVGAAVSQCFAAARVLGPAKIGLRFRDWFCALGWSTFRRRGPTRRRRCLRYRCRYRIERGIVDVFSGAAVNAADLGGDAESAAWAQPDPPERAMGRRWLACRRRRRRWDTMMRTSRKRHGKGERR
jgi:hypothetical protein